MTPEQIVEKIRSFAKYHEPDNPVLQWYVDEFTIDCDAEEFWNMVLGLLKKAMS